jgi:hypothetical protein
MYFWQGKKVECMSIWGLNPEWSSPIYEMGAGGGEEEGRVPCFNYSLEFTTKKKITKNLSAKMQPED